MKWPKKNKEWPVLISQWINIENSKTTKYGKWNKWHILLQSTQYSIVYRHKRIVKCNVFTICKRDHYVHFLKFSNNWPLRDTMWTIIMSFNCRWFKPTPKDGTLECFNTIIIDSGDEFLVLFWCCVCVVFISFEIYRV